MQYDLVIVGGGLVGAGLAAALQDVSLKIALIDAKKPSQSDPRLFALSISSCDFLKNIDVWPQFAHHATAIKKVQVSQKNKFGALNLHADDVKLPVLGYVIPAFHIETALNARLETLKNTTTFRPFALNALTQDESGVTISIHHQDEQKTLRTRFVIAADGTLSTVRQLLNIETQSIAYDQSALVTRTVLKRTHAHTAYERFIGDGAIAMLPLNELEAATIWSGKTSTIQQLQTLDSRAFVQTLQTTFGYKLGKFLQIGDRHVFPLNMVRAEKMAEGQVLLLGNALHTLHPIAAQGFNLALYEVALLAKAIREKDANKQIISAQDLLQVVEAAKKQQKTSMEISHHLASGFNKESYIMNFVLQFGMMGLDLLPTIKRKFIERMLGRNGRVPDLLLHTDNA